MKLIKVMAIAVIFIIGLLSVGLRANTYGKVIQDEMKVCEQDDVTLSCGAASIHNRWKLRTSYGRRVKVPDNPSKYGYINTSLVVKNVQPSDTKSQYICSTKSPIHHFKITYVYTLKIVCKDVQAYAGSNLDLKCNVNIPDDELGKVDWRFRYKDLRKILYPDDRTSMIGKILSIKNVAMSDSGTFACIASRKKLNRSRESFFYNLLVEKAPQTTSSTTTASDTKKPSTKTTKVTSSKPSTTLPPINTFSTTTESPVSERVTTSTDGTATKKLKTLPVTTEPTSPETTEAVPTVKPLPTDGNSITEILPITLNPKHRARTTMLNSVNVDNDIQFRDKVPTTPHSSCSILTISVTTLVCLCVVAALPFYLT